VEEDPIGPGRPPATLYSTPRDATAIVARAVPRRRRPPRLLVVPPPLAVEVHGGWLLAGLEGPSCRAVEVGSGKGQTECRRRRALVDGGRGGWGRWRE
jgi:hypothetical protein